MAVVQIAALDVADELDRQPLKQLECFAGEFVSLALFFTDGKEADAWTFYAENRAAINFAHDRKLLKILRGAINVGADIEENGCGVENSWKGSGKGWAIDSRQSAENKFGGCHGGTGISCRDKSSGTPFAHQAQADTDGGIALGASRLDLIFHGDDFAGMHDFDRQATGSGIAGEFSLQAFF